MKALFEVGEEDRDLPDPRVAIRLASSVESADPANLDVNEVGGGHEEHHLDQGSRQRGRGSAFPDARRSDPGGPQFQAVRPVQVLRSS